MSSEVKKHAPRPPVGRPNASTVSRKSNPKGAAQPSLVKGSRIGGSSRHTLLSSSRSGRTVHVGEKEKLAVHRPPVTVVDPDTGADVTPQPLLTVEPGTVRKQQSNILVDGSQGGTPTDYASQASFYQAGTLNASVLGGAQYTRSVISQQSGAQSNSNTSDAISLSDDLPAAPTGEIPAVADLSTWNQVQREEVREELDEDDLEKVVPIDLEETDTIWLIDMVGTAVSDETKESQKVRERNEKYQQLMKSRVGNDLYSERGMNTFNDAPKLKMVQTDRITYTDVGSSASTWDMFDTYNLTKALEERAAGKTEQPVQDASSGSASKDHWGLDATTVETSVSLKSNQSLLQKKTNLAGTLISRIVEESVDMSDDVIAMTGTNHDPTVDLDKEIRMKKDQEILESEKLKEDLSIMERIVNLNTYQPKLATYRGFKVIEGQEDVPIMDAGPTLERLWCYHSATTKSHNISCLAWNKSNPDLIAVGYGQYEFTNQKGGIVCCWSLKNPEHPERVYYSENGITALDFSTLSANLLAVAMYDGSIAVYNVRSNNQDPILDTFKSAGRHTAPIWQIQWVEKEKGQGEETQQEVLVSISADGRVTQWTIRKGFEGIDLMRLKRVQLKQHVGGKQKEKKGDALISRLAGGFCFSFSEIDGQVYLAGTEEGFIHKCSCSYNEQYLDTYEGHGGPVYKIAWSPFCPDVFLSCSADWSIRLWRQDRLKPIISFFSATKSVNDVCWSPYSSTVFACVNDGAVEVWDLAVSSLDPVIVCATSGPRQTTVSFAVNSRTLLVGDSSGQVTVYQLKGMGEPGAKAVPVPELTDEEGALEVSAVDAALVDDSTAVPGQGGQQDTLNRIIAASLASQLQMENTEGEQEEA